MQDIENQKTVLPLKIDGKLKLKLKKAAEADNRTLHGYIINLLKKLHQNDNGNAQG